MLKKISTLFVAIGALTLVSIAQAPKGDIVDTAVGAGSFKTLVKLVQDAGLVDTLKGKGPFTVFAPTDAAFAKLPKDLVDKVTSDKNLLRTVLTYHVVSGAVRSTDLRNGMNAKTVQGENIAVKIRGDKVMFNKSNLVKADIMTTNGVIHVIDTVMLPPSVERAVGMGKKKDGYGGSMQLASTNANGKTCCSGK
jgi:uncharacterized surface protein with fasciclin (FAS1) repeats